MKKVTFILILTFSFLFGTSQSCLPEGIAFETQAQIDSFSILYPNCTEIEGNVVICGCNITNLNSLIQIESIIGDLYIIHDSSLVSLSGLDNLTQINGNFELDDIYGFPCGNTNLNDITALSNLQYIGGDLRIFRNLSLTDLNGLENLDSIGGSLLLGCEYGGVVNLSSLSGLEGLSYISSALFIEKNPNLLSLEGLENLTYIGENLFIRDNPILLSLGGLESLNSFDGCMYIEGNSNLGFIGMEGLSSINCLTIIGNDSLVNMAGLENLTSIDWFLNISDNYSLINLEGLDDLSSIGRAVTISDNYSLINFAGLAGLGSIGGNLSIHDNNSLISLSGLQDLTSAGGMIVVYSNSLLRSLVGLDNIEPGTIKYLSVHSNPSLSTCHVESVCAYLENPGGGIGISNNAVGCNSSLEVLDSCEANAVAIDEQYVKETLILYPNPAKKCLYISAEGDIIDDVVIYTFTGQRILHVRPSGESLDISSLQAGMYIVEVLVEGRKIRRKLLVNRR